MGTEKSWNLRLYFFQAQKSREIGHNSIGPDKVVNGMVN